MTSFKKITVALLSATASLLLADAAVAQSTYDWSGVYLGGGVGVVESKSDADVTYGTSGSGRWTGPAGYFIGEVYQDVDGSSITLSDSETSALDLPPLTDWLTSAESTELNWSGNVFAGAQAQFGSFVLGGELGATFGEFGTSFEESWEDNAFDSGSVTCGFIGSCQLGTNLPGGIHWDNFHDNANGSFVGVGDSATIDGSVHQDNAISFETSYKNAISATARGGFAADRVLFYGKAGASVAEVTASTSASVTERGDVDVNNGTATADLDGLVNYEWSGSNTETRWGYVVGAGVEFAVTDNIILRGEVSYTDYGTTSVTGVSEDTDATYEVSQKVDQVQLTTGVSFKF